MNRLLRGAVTAAGSLALAGGAVLAVAAPSMASGSGHDNSSYGSAAPAGPITAPPQGLAQSTGPANVVAPNVNINGLLSTSTTFDNANTLAASSRVTSVNTSISAGGETLSLTANQVMSNCRSDTGTGTASLDTAVLTVDGTVLHLPQHPSVNQTFPLDGGSDGTLILNHQIPATGGGVEVQAVDLHYTATTPAQDLFLGVSVCTVPGTAGNTVTVTNPGAQLDVTGSAITPLHITATDSDTSQTLTCSATGLPAGLSIDATTCTITGTPLHAGTTSVTVTATDTTGASDSVTFTWTTGNIVVVDSVPTQHATVGTAFSLTMHATDSDSSITTFTWSASGLPPGLSIDSSTGVISGTPTTATGSPFTVNVTATDSTGASSGFAFNIDVSTPNTITVASPGAQTDSIAAGAITPVTVTVTDSAVAPPGTITCTASGLPAGLSVAASGGNCVISGTPTTAGTTSVTVTATDSAGASGTSAAFSWTITP